MGSSIEQVTWFSPQNGENQQPPSGKGDGKTKTDDNCPQGTNQYCFLGGKRKTSQLMDHIECL